jgi:DNA segregation ATPase FtsK/SpoIIIE, S-DNA-T family
VSELDLSVNRSLGLLQSLEETVADFALREEHLHRDIRTKRFAASRQHQEVIESIEAKLARQVEAADNVLAGHQEQLTSLYEGRRTKLNRAHLVATRSLPKRVKDARGSYLGELQMKKFRLERKLASDLDMLGGNAGEFTEKLTTLQTRFKQQTRETSRLFRGYQTFKKLLRRKPASPDDLLHTVSAKGLLRDFEIKLDSADRQLVEFREFIGARLFSILPAELLVFLVLLIGAGMAFGMGFTKPAINVGIFVALVLLAVVLWFHQTSLKKAKPAAIELADTLLDAGTSHAACQALADSIDSHSAARVQEEFESAVAELEEQKELADDVAADFEKKASTKLATQQPRVVAKIDQVLAARLQAATQQHEVQIRALRTEAESKILQLKDTESHDLGIVQTEEQQLWEQLETEWQEKVPPLYQAVADMQETLEPIFPDWSQSLAEGWKPTTSFAPATKFGYLPVDLGKHALPKDERLALPGPAQFDIPLSLSFPQQGSLLIETSETANEAVMDTVNNIILRLLTTTPPGKLTFTIIDPVGLGKNFAGLMHLADYEEGLINRRIWTQRDHIEERLAELSEHIEKVIQMYLRNEYATITEYNQQAGSVAEKYHFLIIADFPANFSETAAKRLQSIVTSGARCGVFTLVHWDQRQQLPEGLGGEELRKNSICIRKEKQGFTLARPNSKAGVPLHLDAPPEPEIAVDLVHKIGKSSIDSNLVQVPFKQIAPKPEELWTNETTNELRIAVGRTGATKLQYLAIGKGTRQHALFAGKTGSGKSTLFHVIITNLALACSPDEVEFYLIDFKKGVEFKCYASKHLPHARVVAIESDREFALSVLQRVDGELKRRGDIFRKLGVQDIAGYKRAGGTEPMPRSLLLIDEFQEFFVDDDSIAQTASLLFDRIVRQGRAFGIHVLLGSQTLGGAYSLARATLGQMVIRVALQCNEADAYLIMDENNSAPRLLSRPGEGIYNDAAGAMEGNSPFQVVWLPDDERDRWLDKVNELAASRYERPTIPIVFEGNAPADIRENQLLQDVLRRKPTKLPTSPRLWLGAPNSIKGPTEVVFHRQSGNHLLIVGQREEAATSMLALGILALAAQHPAGGARFVVLHSTNPGSSDETLLQQVADDLSQEIVLTRGHDLTELMSGIASELKSRSNDPAASEAPAIFLIIHGLHKFKKLRPEDDFSFSMSDDTSGGNPGAQLAEIITEGSALGIHLITTVDTYNNVNRSLNRKALSEFEMRVVFQMSANDSASLIDSPKASTLGLHRALCFNEHEGTLETFRPYATPSLDWFKEAAASLEPSAA